MKTIKEQIAEYRKQIQVILLRAKNERARLVTEIEILQSQCPHTKTSGRWIMGREHVTECDECDKEM